MATVTPNYSWPVPTSTDLVKDGATAIESLGDAIDATVFGLPASSLVLIKTQTIGTTVSTVNVTSAFSTTYDNYKIIVTGGVSSAATNLSLKLGSTVTGYYAGVGGVVYSSAGGSNVSDNNAAQWTYAGHATTSAICLNAELTNPFLSKNTIIFSQRTSVATNLSGAYTSGFLNDTTSYTDFTIFPVSGTLTGGTIRVYGYKN
jgi:hypothetical protein